jgi:hypothetical protein
MLLWFLVLMLSIMFFCKTPLSGSGGYYLIGTLYCISKGLCSRQPEPSIVVLHYNVYGMLAPTMWLYDVPHE